MKKLIENNVYKKVVRIELSREIYVFILIDVFEISKKQIILLTRNFFTHCVEKCLKNREK